MPEFSIIVPVFQEYNIFYMFWLSLMNTIQYPTQVILINDASPVQTTEFINQIDTTENESISLNIIAHKQSKGYSISVNEAFDSAVGRFVVLMDSDIILTEKWQDKVIANLSDSSVGGMGCVLIYPQTGGIQNCGLTYTNSTGRHLYLNNSPDILDFKHNYRVQSTVFAFFATRLDIVHAVGKLDNNFFNGYEDIDYQLRIYEKLQKNIIIDPSLRMFHWEQSNGILRNYNRRSNLALLWKKHGNILNTDLWDFLFVQFNKHNCHNFQYIGVDLSSARLDASDFWSEIKKRYPDCIHNVLEYFHNIHDNKNIWLSQHLPYDFFRTEQPILFLCDHFVKLLDNQYWLNFRKQYCQEDIIIDLYGNVISWSQLEDKFWPGTKIR